jgi:hypothetical protein
MIRALLWTVIFLFVLQVTYAQTKEELLEQRDKILKDITLTNKLIKIRESRREQQYNQLSYSTRKFQIDNC